MEILTDYLLTEPQDTITLENTPVFFPMEESVALVQNAIDNVAPGGTLTIIVPNFSKQFHDMLTGPFELTMTNVVKMFKIGKTPVRCLYTVPILARLFDGKEFTITEEEATITLIWKR